MSQCRSSSTLSNNPNYSTNHVVFLDADKVNILDYVKGKVGIYMWTNKVNYRNI